MAKIFYIFLLLPLLALGGCGDANEDAIDSPHPVGAAWLNPANADFHGATADASCDQCHASGGAIVSCDSCHFGPTGSKVPAGVTWTHGTVPHDSLKTYETTCNKCHDLLRSYNDGPNSCHDCHGSSANHVLGEPWLNPANNGFHGDAATQSGANCTQCHGADYLGGSSGVSCSKCHFGQTGSKIPTGVTNWTHGAVPHGDLKAYEATCNACHDLMRTYGRTIDSKSATCSTCHGGSVAPHAVGQDWLLRSGHVAAAADSCLGCHVADGSGIGPSCLSCHTAGDPLTTSASCASCHNSPPSLPSTAIADRPNRAGAHAVHTPLTADTAACSACHSGAGTDTVNHYDTTEPASMQFLAAYNASSTASFATGSCSNVSCHGGVTTPAWATGAINVYGGGTAACQQCHKASGETNSYASGKHDKHVRSKGYDCAICHNLTVLENGSGGASHFSGLQTAAFELNPSLTINSSLNYNGTSCNPSCHGSKSW